MSSHDIHSGRQNRPLGMHPRWWRKTHGPREIRVRSTHGLRPSARLRRLRAAIRWRSPSARLHLSGSVSLLGIRATDLPRESARHRDVSPGPRAQAVSCGVPWPSLSEHIGRCQPRPRLAHLRRLRPSADRPGAEALRHRILRRGVGAHRVCLRQHHDRSLPEPLPWAAVPPPQGGGEAAHRSWTRAATSPVSCGFPTGRRPT